jgi:MSHA biogenesis protein MshI
VIPWGKRSPKAAGRVALDVPTHGVAVSHLEGIERDRPRLTWYGYWPRRSPGSSTRDAAREIRERGLVGSPCVAVLSPDRYILRLLDAPDVEREDLAEAARWLVKDLIDFPVADAVVDFFEIPQEQRSDRVRRIYVVAAPAEAVQEVVGFTDECGLQLQSVGVRELALANLCNRLANGAEGAALLQVGRRQGLIVTVQEGTLRLVRRLEARLGDLVAGSRVFEAGGQIFEPEAREFEADSHPLLAGAAENHEALLLEVQRSLDYHESQLVQAPVSKLWFAPLEEEVPELVPLLEKNLTVEVCSLGLSDLLETDELVPAPEQARCLAAIGAVLGMADPA